MEPLGTAAAGSPRPARLKESQEPQQHEIIVLEACQRVTSVDCEEPAALQFDLPIVSDPPFHLDKEQGRLVLDVNDGPDERRRALHVVQRQPSADEDVVVEWRDRRVVVVAAVIQVFG